MPGDGRGEAGWHGVADLLGDLDLGAAPQEVLGKSCSASASRWVMTRLTRLPGRRASHCGCRYWPFSGLKNSVRIVRDGASHRMRPMTSVVPVVFSASSGQQVVRQVEAPAARRDAVVALQ